MRGCSSGMCVFAEGSVGGCMSGFMDAWVFVRYVYVVGWVVGLVGDTALTAPHAVGAV